MRYGKRLVGKERSRWMGDICYNVTDLEFGDPQKDETTNGCIVGEE